MKKILILAISLIGLSSFYQTSAQKVKTIKLVQTEGEFDVTSLNLKAGKTYQFEVMNKDVDKEVGFVIAPANMTDQKHHIQDAYLSKTITKGETGKSGEVTLEPGEYVYFCPLNPTPEYKIMVK